MSVTTRADEVKTGFLMLLRACMTYFETIQQDIAEMLSPDTWGGNSWSQEFIEDTRRLEKGIFELLQFAREYFRKWG